MPEFSDSQHAYTCLPGLEYSLVRATIRPRSLRSLTAGL